MTHRQYGKMTIAVQAPEVCDLCGKTAECRPYGPNGENVCFPCGMQDRAAAERAFLRRLAADDEGES